jgi:DMSO/TMAO reductase YedYZ molybdopterin-dependent catalytic subunit
LVGLVVIPALAVLISCNQPQVNAVPALSHVSTTPSTSNEPSPTTPHSLTVDGLVNTPLKLSYESLLEYPAVTETATLYCPGVYENESPREWFGVALSTILKDAGIKPEATTLTFYAADGYKTVLSIDKINSSGAILAYPVDGQTLSQGDGYPLRLVSKELEGGSWIRWINRIEAA